MNIDPRLEEASAFVTDLGLCQVRLMNNAKFPWVMLIPKSENASEIIDLSEDDQLQLMREIAQTSHIFKELFNPDKLNVAALGVVVPQLHVHVIARYKTDAVWPGFVWNSGVSEKYSHELLNARISEISAAYEVYKSASAC